jgi:hypothetical protein
MSSVYSCSKWGKLMQESLPNKRDTLTIQQTLTKNYAVYSKLPRTSGCFSLYVWLQRVTQCNVLKLSGWQNLIKSSRADSCVKVWNFSEKFCSTVTFDGRERRQPKSPRTELVAHQTSSAYNKAVLVSARTQDAPLETESGVSRKFFNHIYQDLFHGHNT